MTNAVYLASLVNSSGNNVTLQGGVVGSGTGISFPATQSASSDANTLDDYEEGTFTLTANSGTITNNNAWYSKVGKLVTVSCTIGGFSDRTSATQIILSGLPFVVGNNTSTAASTGLFRYCNSSPSFYANGNENKLYLYISGSGGYANFNYNALNNASAEMYIQLNYQASA